MTAAAIVAGCSRKAADDGDTSPVAVSVSQPIEREVTDAAEFVGRTDAPFALEVRPRVSGYLTKMPFTEGAVIKAGDVLFEIDDRPYVDELHQAEASLERAKASLVRAQAFLEIGLQTQRLNAGAVSEQEIVQRQGARDEAAATVNSAKATLEKCQLNCEWCKVTSAIDGRVSRYYLTLGNLATQDTSLLTKVVSEDPLYVYFDVDERTVLRIVRSLLPNSTDMLKARKIPVLVGLADEDGFPHRGYIDFADNVINSATGTITLRGVLANPPIPPSGHRLLKPGMFVHVRLPLGQPYKALLVNEKALGTDQGKKYLLVVDAQNVVQYRPVQVGPPQSDGLRVIKQGLRPGESVIVSGLQLVRPKQTVKPEPSPMQGGTAGEAKGPESETPPKAEVAPGESSPPAPSAGGAKDPPAADGGSAPVPADQS